MPKTHANMGWGWEGVNGNSWSSLLVTHCFPHYVTSLSSGPQQASRVKEIAYWCLSYTLRTSRPAASTPVPFTPPRLETKVPSSDVPKGAVLRIAPDAAGPTPV